MRTRPRFGCVCVHSAAKAFARFRKGFQRETLRAHKHTHGLLCVYEHLRRFQGILPQLIFCIHSTHSTHTLRRLLCPCRAKQQASASSVPPCHLAASDGLVSPHQGPALSSCWTKLSRGCRRVATGGRDLECRQTTGSFQRFRRLQAG